jgi:hypothetical protein
LRDLKKIKNDFGKLNDTWVEFGSELQKSMEYFAIVLKSQEKKGKESNVTEERKKEKNEIKKSVLPVSLLKRKPEMRKKNELELEKVLGNAFE